MIDRRTSVDTALSTHVRSGQTLMIGGFGRGGTPFTLLERMSDQPARYTDLTLAKNDANEPDLGIDLLLSQGMVSHLIATHIGLNPNFVAQMNRGDVSCELVPQGIFAERLRAGGAGIPAFMTDIGIDTEVAEGKPTYELDGKTYLIERALRGDVAMICADRADMAGNAWWSGSSRNMCIAMAMACNNVIVEAKEIVKVGELDPSSIHLPHAFVNAVVQAEPRRHQQSTAEATS